MSDLSVREVTPREAYDAVANRDDARLVDVRTRAEWTFVGLPELGARPPILVEWQSFPEMQVATSFATALQEACPDRATFLYFICRSGQRSRSAAALMNERGYANVFNVTGGFEGPPDAEGHRGTTAGWKADGLPWRQS